MRPQTYKIAELVANKVQRPQRPTKVWPLFLKEVASHGKPIYNTIQNTITDIIRGPWDRPGYDQLSTMGPKPRPKHMRRIRKANT